MADEILKQTEESMTKTINNLASELASIRTGKASPALLDNIRIDYFGQQMPLSQVATVGAPDPRLLTIQPWDKSVIPLIEKAIQNSEMGLNPQNDGTLIRVPIPPLTEERRKDFVKLAKKSAEDAKVALRNIRRDANERLKKAQKAGDLSEDNMHTAQDGVQKVTDKFTTKVDDMTSAKEKEILEI